jgi:hypothetical protein
MSKQPFLPRTDLGKMDWLKNFAGKLGFYAAKYNISPAQVTDMLNSLPYFIYWMDYRKKYEDYLYKLTEFKNELINGVAAGAQDSVQPAPPMLEPPPMTVSSGIFKRATSIANVIKSQAIYTVADGNDLGIEGAESVMDIHNMKPVLNLHLIAGGHPEIKWTKQRMDGIEIYVDRGSGNWELLAYDTFPNYTDTAPLPALGSSMIWKYKAIYRYNDEQAGLWSDEVKITVSGV